jgi:hypothetical protein
MQIDIPAHIEKLLFLHNTLVIPGFGGFTATRSPAVADYVGGTVSPPAKTLAFSDQMVADDGILVNDIAATHSVATEDAQKAVSDFVQNMQELLNQREIVTLPGVGRLYKNYVQKIQFLPDATNFNSESFGLPPLQFSPIARSREIEEKAPETTPATTQPATTQPSASAPPPYVPPVAPPPVAPPPVVHIPEPAPPIRSRTPAFLWIILMLVAIAFGTWWWRYKHKHSSSTTPTAKTEMVEEDITARDEPKKAPAPSSPTVNQKPPAAVEPAAEPPAAPVHAAPAPKKTPPPAPRISGGGKQCVLVVATLQEKANADRLVRTIQNGGYQVYMVQKKGYQVGIQFNYSNLTEVQQKIVELQKLTGENQIWIKQK